MSCTKETFLNKLSDVGFALFYIALFALQALPSFAIAFLEYSNPLLWVACGAGLVAMVVQAIKFPCAATMIWRSGAIAAIIAAIVGL